MSDARHVFHGHAAALSGRIVRIGEGKKARFVKDAFIDLPAAALPSAGGRSTASISRRHLTHPFVRTFVRFKSATASSEGVFDDAKAHYVATLGQRGRRVPTARTTVSAEIEGLDVGLKGGVRMRVARVAGGFTAQKDDGGGDTSIQLSRDTGFGGNSVTFVDADGRSYVLTVGVERDLFRTHDTFSRITTAAAKPAFMRRFAHVLHGAGALARRGTKAALRLVKGDDGAVQGTVVKPLKWKGPAFPGATIDPERTNAVSIPGFGKVFFGEITLAPQSRRLTMLRLSFGSPIGGDAAAADVMDNGSVTV
jgi:hypothetical protein